MSFTPLPCCATHVIDALAMLQDVSAPVIFFQGDADKVVPPEQAVAMHDALKARGMPTALVMFAGEQHGFRQVRGVAVMLL